MIDKRKLKLLIAAAALFVIVTVGISIFLIIRSQLYSATLFIEFTPISSSARLEGDFHQTLAQGENQIRPGSYTVFVKKDGFAEFSTPLTIADGDWRAIYAILDPNREDTMDWYENHPEDAELRDKLADRIHDPNTPELQATIADQTPPGVTFPVFGPGVTYRIDYGQSPTRPGGFALFGTYYNAVGYELLQQQLKSYTTAPGLSYEIILVDETEEAETGERDPDFFSE